MGYEVIIRYHEISDDESEEEAEVQTKNIKVGSAYDDVPLEVCAGKIIAQLANRKREIDDVEVYQFTKKKLSYRQTEEAIFIKNNKFSFDDGPVVQSSGQTPEEQLMALLQANPTLLQQLGQVAQVQMPQPMAQPAPLPNGNGAVPLVSPTQLVGIQRPAIREETFDPPHPGISEIERGFTVGRDYPIYEDVTRGKPPFTRFFYLVGDNSGQKVKKPAEFFVPKKKQKLAHADEMDGPDQKAPDIQLDYGGGAGWEGSVQDVSTY